jgi:3-oxoacyl-(acyl-carrier-protein) synthase
MEVVISSLVHHVDHVEELCRFTPSSTQDRASIRPGAVHSTPLNDASEAAAFADVFGNRSSSIPVMAQKGVLGHPLGASNLLEVVGLAGLLPKGVLPPVKNTTRDTLDEPVDLVLDEPRHVQPEYVIKTSSGFSGLHSACVLRVIL